MSKRIGIGALRAVKKNEGELVQLTEINGANALSLEETSKEETPVDSVVIESGVSISFRKAVPKRLVNTMASANNAQVQESDDSYIISAPHIKIARADVETVVGKVSDAKWRMLFVNRTGEVKEFNNYEFTIGTPKPVVTEEEVKAETVQLNIRIDKHIKEELEKYRSADFLDLTQNAFVEEALKEFIANIKNQIL